MSEKCPFSMLPERWPRTPRAHAAAHQNGIFSKNLRRSVSSEPVIVVSSMVMLNTPGRITKVDGSALLLCR
jgi:hypothetical protein